MQHLTQQARSLHNQSIAMFCATVLTFIVANAAPVTGLSEAAERVLLPDARVAVEVDGLSRQIRLRSKNARSLQSTVKPSRLCPKRDATYDGVILTCLQRRIVASVSRARGQQWLDIRVSRGIPWGGHFDSIPSAFASPQMWNIAEICPGISPAGKAECLLAENKKQEAKKALLQSNKTDNETALAQLRRGDLARADNDFNAALTEYTSIQIPGPAMRFADAHICELSGNCFNAPNGLSTFEHQGLKEPLETEMELRSLRVYAYQGFDDMVLHRLKLRLASTRRPPLCEKAMLLCHSMVLAALRSDDVAVRLDALELYTSGALPLRGGRNKELAKAASDVAFELGAPGFAASLLASAANEVERGELADYLVRTAELYFQAKDTIRADVIVSFAKSKLSASEWARAQWKMTQLGIGQPRAPEKKFESIHLPEVDLAKELAQVALLRSQLRQSEKPKEQP